MLKHSLSLLSFRKLEIKTEFPALEFKQQQHNVAFVPLTLEVAGKTFWKIETAHAIFWMYLGGTAKKTFFRNKTFFVF